MTSLEEMIKYDQEWLKSAAEYEKGIRYAEVKSLCNSKSIFEMRHLLRLTIGKLKQIHDEAIANREVKS